ncbi:MAG TPA: inorganic diphosphatase [Planctomycetota bacterium]|nr:inorganic diphosphatase [Planctomycetota bacterium]
MQYDAALGVFRLDRTLYSPVEYPCEYGFIPSTFGGDGDPLDLLVLSSEPTFPGCLIAVRPVARLGFHDEHGDDAKILSVPVADPRFRAVHDSKSILPHTLREIEEFFRTYSALEKKPKILEGWSGRAAALQEIRAAHRRFLSAENHAVGEDAPEKRGRPARQETRDSKGPRWGRSRSRTTG